MKCRCVKTFPYEKMGHVRILEVKKKKKKMLNEGDIAKMNKIKTSVERGEYVTMVSHAGPVHSLGWQVTKQI